MSSNTLSAAPIVASRYPNPGEIPSVGTALKAQVDSVDSVAKSARISGTGTPNESVHVAGQTIPIAADGTWKATIPGLKEGVNDVLVEQYAGTTLLDSVTLHPEVVTAPVADLTGAVSFDADVTKVPTIAGTAATGATISVLEGTKVLASGIPVTGTNWTTTLPAELGTGSHTFTVIQKLKGVETKITVTAAFGRKVGITSPSDNAAVPATPLNLGVTTQKGAQLVVTEGSTTLKTQTAAGATDTIGLGALTSGAHTLTVTQTSKGDVTTTATVHVTVASSTVAPVVVTSPIDYALVKGQITTTGTGQDGATVTIYAAGGIVVGKGQVVGGKWSIVDSQNLLPVGRYQYRVSQTLGGNTSEALASVDHVPANYVAAAVTTPADNATVPTAKPTLTGTGTPGGAIQIYNGTTLLGTAPVSATGTWTSTLGAPLTTGANTLTVKQIIPGGHVDSLTHHLTLAAVAPVVVTSPVGYALVKGQITTTGTGEDGATVTIYAAGGIVVGKGQVVGGKWSIVDTQNLLPDGHYQYRVSQTLNGNTTEALAFVDHVPAYYVAPAVTTPADNATVTTSKPTMTGTGTPGGAIQIFSGTTLLGTAPVSAAGTWTSTLTTPLGSGVNTLSVKQVVSGGHADSLTHHLTLATAPLVVVTPQNNEVVAGPITTSGTGEDGALVTVYGASGVAIGTDTVVNGKWSVVDTMNLLPFGVQSYKVTMNADGKVTEAIAHVSHVPANFKPMTLTSPTAGSSYAGAFRATGTATPGGQVRIIENGVVLQARPTDTTTGEFDIPCGTLTPGTHDIIIRQIVDGGYAQDLPFTITIQ